MSNNNNQPYIQDLLPFIGVQGNIIVNRDETYSMVLTLSGLNLHLMSGGEKQALHRRLGSIFNLLEGHKSQLLATVRTRDVKPLINELATARDHETVPNLIEQAYIEEDFLNKLSREGGIISRDYYLIVRLGKNTGQDDEEEKLTLWDEFMIAFGVSKKTKATIQSQTVRIPEAIRDRAGVLADTLIDGLRGIGFSAALSTEKEIEDLLQYLLNGVGSGGDLVDRCVPPRWEVEGNHLRLGDSLYVAGLYGTTFPMHVRVGWLEQLIKQPEQMVISVHFDILTGAKAEKALSGKASLLEAMEMAGSGGGSQQRVEGFRRAYQMQSANLMMDALAREEEKIGFLSVRVLVQAESEPALTRRVRRLEQKLSELRLMPASALLRQDTFLFSCLPLAMDTIAGDTSRRNATTSGMVCTIPNVVMDLGHHSGMVLGINKQDRSLVVLDRFKLTSYHKVCIAETGSGKSVSEAIETIRGLLRGWQYVWFDPQNTLMPQLVAMTGGEIIDLGPSGNAIINPLDRNGTDSTSLSEKIIFITALIQLMAERTLDAAEKSRLARAIKHCYDDNPYRTPILQDLVAILSGEGLAGLAEELERFIDPHIYGTMFNGETNVALGNRHISFNLRDLDESQLRPIRIFQALEYTWGWIRSSRWPPKVMVVDEIGLLLRFPDIAQYVRDLFKRGRAFGLSVVAIDQNPANFIENSFGRQMIENAALVQLMKQNEIGVDLLRQHFNLTQGEVDLLLAAEPGDALLIVEGKRLHMRYSISEAQLDMLSTRPEEVAGRDK